MKERPIWDIYLVERHLYAGYFTKTYSLKDMARRYLDATLDKETRDAFSDGSEMTQELAQYAAMDAWATAKIAERQMELEHSLNFDSYHMVNEPVIWAVLDMPPVRVDKDKWVSLAKHLGDEGRKLQATLGDINVNSPVQVRAFAQSLVGRDIKDTTKETLEGLAGDPDDEEDGGIVPLKRVMKARSLLKMESAYGPKFLETMGPGGYILPGWRIDGADTGRMACADPHFHNVPVRDYPEYRTAVIPSDGNIFGVSDASQQEPRTGAVFTKDPELLRLVRTGESIYIKVANEMMGIEMTKDNPRYIAIKAVVLGTFYGLTPSGLARREKIPRREAQALQALFFQKFKMVKPWMGKVRGFAWKHGYVETMLGRRLWVNLYDSQWENAAVNYPIQGTAAEITKLALVYMHQEMKARGLPFAVVLQIHDELDVDIEPELKPDYAKVMQDTWNEAGHVILPSVPFVTEFGWGDSWGCKV